MSFISKELVSYISDIYIKICYFAKSICNGFKHPFRQTGVEDVNNNGRGSVMVDFNYDGRMDLAFTNWLGPTRLYQQQRDNNTIMFRVNFKHSLTNIINKQ